MGRYETFFVRVWITNHGDLRGTVRHTGSGESLAFLDVKLLATFVEIHCQESRPGNHQQRPGDPEDDPASRG